MPDVDLDAWFESLPTGDGLFTRSDALLRNAPPRSSASQRRRNRRARVAAAMDGRRMHGRWTRTKVVHSRLTRNPEP